MIYHHTQTIPTTFRIVVVLVAVTVSQEGSKAVTVCIIRVAIGGHVVVVDARGAGVYARETPVSSRAASEGGCADAGACTAIAAVVLCD